MRKLLDYRKVGYSVGASVLSTEGLTLRGSSWMSAHIPEYYLRNYFSVCPCYDVISGL